MTDRTEDLDVEGLPDVLPGHWTTPEGREMAAIYAGRSRSALGLGHAPDFEVANAVYLVDRHSFDLLAMQTAAKERIRWLSVQLALRDAALQASQSEAAGLRVERDELRDMLDVERLRFDTIHDGLEAEKEASEAREAALRERVGELEKGLERIANSRTGLKSARLNRERAAQLLRDNPNG